MDPSEMRTSALMRRVAAVLKAAVPGVAGLARELEARAALLDREATMVDAELKPTGRPCPRPNCEMCVILHAIKELPPPRKPLPDGTHLFGWDGELDLRRNP